MIEDNYNQGSQNRGVLGRFIGTTQSRQQCGSGTNYPSRGSNQSCSTALTSLPLRRRYPKVCLNPYSTKVGPMDSRNPFSHLFVWLYQSKTKGKDINTIMKSKHLSPLAEELATIGKVDDGGLLGGLFSDKNKEKAVSSSLERVFLKKLTLMIRHVLKQTDLPLHQTPPFGAILKTWALSVYWDEQCVPDLRLISGMNILCRDDQSRGGCSQAEETWNDVIFRGVARFDEIPHGLSSLIRTSSPSSTTVFMDNIIRIKEAENELIKGDFTSAMLLINSLLRPVITSTDSKPMVADVAELAGEVFFKL